jgi:hypothetical protein
MMQNGSKQKKLNVPRMLEKGDPEKIIYSFTLYEKTTQGNLLRVQTDNYMKGKSILFGIK